MLDEKKVPTELREMPNWVLWKYIPDRGKIPFNAKTLRRAQSNNPLTWSDFETAYEVLINNPQFSGLGFMLSNGINCIDLDNKDEDDLLSDEEFHELLEDCLSKIPSYCEVSFSGKGYHIFSIGTLPHGSRRRGHVEMYDKGRFIALTGNIYKGYTEIINAQDGLNEIHAKYLGGVKKASQGPYKPAVVDYSVTASKVLERAKNNSKFMTLYQGNWKQLGFDSQSEADSSFAALLAFYAGKNISVMDEIFRSSGLMRKKYERVQNGSTYGRLLLESSAAFVTDVYTERPKETRLVEYKAEKKKIKTQKVAGEVVNPVITKSRFTDTANSSLLINVYGKDILWNFDNKIWMIWDGTVWKNDVKEQIRIFAEKVANDALEEAREQGNNLGIKNALRMLNTTGKNNMIREAAHHRGITNDECDKNKLLLNTQSGIVNLETGVLSQSNRDEHMTKVTTVGIDGGEPKLWLKFLSEIFQNDKELINYVQKAVGYTLSGSIKEQVVFILFGEGNNGKSVFVDTLENALGDYAITVPVEVLMEKKNRNNVETTIARIKAARMIHASENDVDDKINEGLIKQITGGEKVIGRFLFGNQFEYYPEYKLWLSTNNKPRIKGTDYGIWRRLVVIPFNVIIPPDKVDRDLGAKLMDELPQILNWAVEGFKKYKEEGLVLPQVLIDEKNKYRGEMDFMGNFIADRIDKKIGYKTLASTLYKEYEKWCRTSNARPISFIAFGKEFGKHFEKKRESVGNLYIDCKIKSDNEEFAAKTWGDN